MSAKGETDVPRGFERRGMNIIEALILASIVGMAATTIYQGKAIIEMQASINYMREDLSGLRTQLADVPQLSRQAAELKIRVDRHDEDLKELRVMRGGLR